MAAMVIPLLLALLHLAVPGLAQSPPPGTVTISSYNYGGSGCSSASVSVILSSEGLPSLEFTKFTAFTPGPKADLKKSCQVGITLNYPAGFTFTVASVTLQGSVHLDPGVKGSLAVAYYLSDMSGTARSLRSLPPPSDGKFDFTESFATSLYAPCGSKSATFNLQTAVRVVPPSTPTKNNQALIFIISKGSITVDRQSFSLRWKKC